MLYLVPAWYKQNNWNIKENSWYATKVGSECDDTVKQIQLFHRRRLTPYQVVILGHMPGLRHHLHRQGIFRANYWSCFDAITEVKKRKVSLFSFRSIKWPDGVEFEYTPFAIIANLNGQIYAQIEMGEDGNMVCIDMYRDDCLIQRNIYDDRGFVARATIFSQGKELYDEYYMDNGIWKMRQYFEDGHVEINPNHASFLLSYQNEDYVLPFKTLTYASIDDVISEVFSEYAALTEETDMFCLAMHPMNVRIIREGFIGKKLILSFYEDRMTFDIDKNSRQILKNIINLSSYIVTDSVATSEYIKSRIEKDSVKIIDISPYDSRHDLGISQQMQAYKILVPVDGLGDLEFEQVIKGAFAYYQTNRKIQVHLFTRLGTYQDLIDVIERTKAMLRQTSIEDDYLQIPSDDDDDIPMKKLGNENDIEPLFFIEQCADELSATRCIREQRLLVDLRDKSEQYIQIAAISAGIPQIVKTPSEFVENKYNGIVLKNMGKLPQIFRYYLDGLSNWNDAMINAYKMGEKYSTRVLIEKWKEVLREVEQS